MSGPDVGPVVSFRQVCLCPLAKHTGVLHSMPLKSQGFRPVEREEKGTHRRNKKSQNRSNSFCDNKEAL